MARDAVVAEYLEAVAGRIRWRRARGPLLRELGDHIADQAQSFESAGSPPTEAAERAVAEMGEPLMVGEELNRLHRPQNRWGMALAALAVLALGLAALVALGWDGDQITRQVLALGAGLVLCAVAWFSDYTLVIRNLYLIAGVLAVCTFCVMPAFFFMGGQTDIAYFSSTTGRTKALYFLLLLPVLYAALVCRLKGRGKPTVAALSVLAPLLALLPPLATPFGSISVSLTVLAVCLAVLGAAVGMGWFRGKRLAGLLCAWGLPLVSGCFVLLRHWEFFYRRLILPNFFPQADPLTHGYFAITVRAALSRLPFLNPSGVPLTEESLLFEEFILLRLANRLGWAVFLLAGALLLAFAVWVSRRAFRLRSRTGRLMALPCAALLLVQGGISLLNNLGVAFPLLVYDTFPLLTYGPGMLVVDLLLVGLLLSVLRMDALVRDPGGGERRRRNTPPGVVDIPLPFGKGHLHIERRET